jgi:hypothetical protein
MSTATDKKFVSAFDLFPKSLNLVKEHWQLFTLVNIMSLLSAVLAFGHSGASTGTSDANSLSAITSPGALATILGISMGMAAVLVVIGAVLQVMELRLTLDVAQKVKTDTGKLWEFTRQYFFRLLGLGIVAGLLIVGGLILLIVPGVILITRYFFAPYVMIDENLGIMASLKRSTELSEGMWGPIWSVIGVTLLLALIPSFFGKVGDLVAALLAITYSVAPALRYLEVKKASK